MAQIPYQLQYQLIVKTKKRQIESCYWKSIPHD